jgi:hypothetical protein
MTQLSSQTPPRYRVIGREQLAAGSHDLLFTKLTIHGFGSD